MRRYHNGKRVQNKNNIIGILALIFIVAALGIVLYRVIGLYNQFKGEVRIESLYNANTPEVNYENIVPITADIILEHGEDNPEPTMQPKFSSLYSENHDTVGWLKLEGTRIDHVVVQGENNVYYLEHDFFGNKSSSATMMLDMQCDITNMKYHYVIYGHRMKSGTMMNDILLYEDEDYFYDNPIIHFDTIFKDMDWEVFSTYCTDYNYDNTRVIFSSDAEWLNYIIKLQGKSIYQNDIELNMQDVVLTLYTCDYRIAGGRYVVHARLITELDE